MLVPTGLEVQTFVAPKDDKNVPAGLKGKIEKEVTGKSNML